MRQVRFRAALGRLPAVALAVTAGFALLVTAAVPAQALTVAPSTRTFGSLIDAPATWERESGCDQTEKKGPRRLRKLLISTYGLMSSNILRPCSAADSGHEEGRALDWMVDVRDAAQKEIAESFLTWLQAPDEFGNPSAMARRMGISYVIWNNAIWRPAAGLWSDYGTCAKPRMRFKKFDNGCHRNHVHVSFSWDGALGRTSFYTGFVSCPRPLTEPWVPVIVPAAPEVVPVEPSRVLATRDGLGLTTGPCRAHPGVRLDVPVLGAGTVPVTGVAAVTLRITVTKPDAPTELRAWTAGTVAPFEPLLVVPQRTGGLTEVSVPVGPDGLVSMALTGGMAHVTVDLIGYAPAG